MDDFFTSMLEAGAFDTQDKDSELQIKSNPGSSTSIFADALVPINPFKWPAFMAGSAASSDMPDLSGKLGTPFANLQVAQEYLETALSDVQNRDRFWQLSEDTVTINAMCELGGTLGSFSAGTLSNKMADRYMNEMVETELSKNLNEELNLEIFKITAQENQRDPNNVRGTGIIRENVPEYMKGDLCDRPERNERPSEWGDMGGDEGELSSGSGPYNPNDPPESGSPSDSIGQIGGLGSEPNISRDESNSNWDNEGGRIFAKCFGWLFDGGSGADQCFDQVPMSPYEVERLREQAEDDFYLGGGCHGMPLDIDHPAYNPPLFCPEIIQPPE